MKLSPCPKKLKKCGLGHLSVKIWVSSEVKYRKKPGNESGPPSSVGGIEGYKNYWGTGKEKMTGRQKERRK